MEVLQGCWTVVVEKDQANVENHSGSGKTTTCLRSSEIFGCLDVHPLLHPAFAFAIFLAQSTGVESWDLSVKKSPSVEKPAEFEERREG
jgi:hypothetical protein